MSVHDCFCFCGFVLLVFGGIAGLVVLMQREGEEVKSTITIKTEQGYVKKVVAEFTPSDYLVVSKALILLSENKIVNEIDRQRARELHEMGLISEGEDDGSD